MINRVMMIRMVVISVMILWFHRIVCQIEH